MTCKTLSNLSWPPSFTTYSSHFCSQPHGPSLSKPKPYLSCFITIYILSLTFAQYPIFHHTLMKTCLLFLEPFSLSDYYFLYHPVTLCFRSVQFSCSVVSDCLRPHESQPARPPCPSPSPGVHSNSLHQVRDAIQPSHPLSSPSPAPNPSQHQGLFQ